MSAAHLNMVIKEVIDSLKSDPAMKGPKGDRGTDGRPGQMGAKGDKGDKGDPGRGIESVTLVNGELTINYTDGTSVELGSIVPPSTGQPISHIVLVRDTTAGYWPRMEDELARARGHYSGIEEAEPPDFATPLPQLIAYREGSPIFLVSGVREVSEVLNKIARDDFDLTKD